MTMPSSAQPAPPHAPTLGLSYRLLGRFHVTGVFWYRFPYYGFRRLPAWTDWLTVAVFTPFFFLTMGRIRRAVGANLEPVLGRAGPVTRWRRSFRTLRSFAWCLIERYRRFSTPQRFRAVLEGEDHWREVMATGGGAIVVTAHIGTWESAVGFGASEAKRKVHVVREKELDPRAQEFVEEIVARSGEGYVTHFAEDDPALALELVKALRRGDVVALQGDRPRAGGRAIEVSLFGRPLPLPVGPAALARAAEVPLLPVFNFRDGRFRLRSVARPPIHVARTADRDADIAAATDRLGAEIEWAIRRQPHQWFCFRKLWS
jgi:lauroyl/myristoyl acyltransferase